MLVSGKIFLGSDHAGFQAKESVKKFLLDLKCELQDLGVDSDHSVSYSEYAIKVAQAVQNDPKSLGILICGSGIGVSIAANRFKSIRAARCLSLEDAQLAKRHNNANVLCLAGRMTEYSLMHKMILAWLQESFEGDRHQQRIDRFDLLGQ